MNSVPQFVEHKDLKAFCKAFSVPFGNRWVQVYLYRTVIGLRRNVYYEPNDEDGAYVAYPYRKKTAGLFGEFHLLIESVDAAYFAHELQHLMDDLAADGNSDGEWRARVAEVVTDKFWKTYEGVK